VLGPGLESYGFGPNIIEAPGYNATAAGINMSHSMTEVLQQEDFQL